MSFRRALPFLLLLAAALPLGALSIDDIDVNTSFLWIGAVPPTAYANDGPNPSTTYLIGVSLPLRIVGPFFLEPGIEMYGDYYEWTGTYGTAAPVVYETGAGFYTLGVLLSTQAGLSFTLSQAISLGGAMGLDFLFRFPFELTNHGSGQRQRARRALACSTARGGSSTPRRASSCDGISSSRWISC